MTTVNIDGGTRQPGDYVTLRMGDDSTLAFDGSAIFDISARYGGQHYNVCSNVTRENAEAIIAGLQAAFPPLPEPEPVVPELVIPEVHEVTAIEFKLDGVRYVATNWFDFEGWEVRRRSEYYMKRPPTLGYIWNIVGDSCNARTADGENYSGLTVANSVRVLDGRKSR